MSPIFLRRRFPFAGPAAYWVLAVAIALVDWRLIPFAVSLFPVGLAVAFLLGNLRNTFQTALGLAIVVAGSAIVVYEIPGSTTAELIFIPLEFAIALARRLRGARAVGAGRGGRDSGGRGRA